jgi:hypothetical protein
MGWGSSRLAYLYLPSIILILCLLSMGLDYIAGRQFQTTVIAVIPFMLVMLAIGVKNKVWNEK